MDNPRTAIQTRANTHYILETTAGSQNSLGYEMWFNTIPNDFSLENIYVYFNYRQKSGFSTLIIS